MITMCNNALCPLATTCKRHAASGTQPEAEQNYGEAERFQPYTEPQTDVTAQGVYVTTDVVKCHYYWEVR